MLVEVRPVALPAWVGSVPLLRGGWSTLLWIVPVVALMLALRLYQQAFGLTYGLDSTSPEFNRYWMSLVPVEGVGLGLIAFLVWGGILATRCPTCARGSPEPRHVEVHIQTLLSFQMVALATVFFAISVFAEQDASWHQALIRDTIFTPTHITLFFFTLPLTLVLFVGSFLYLKTRLPQVYGGMMPLAFVVSLFGIVVGAAWESMNEVGHTFYFAEETFSVPIHWGFVAAGLTTTAFMGVMYDVNLFHARLKEEMPGGRP